MDKCPLCGALVKEDNLPKHYSKIHPHRAGLLTKSSPTSRRGRRTGSLLKHRSSLIVAIILAIAIGGIVVAAADFVNANTVRESFRVQVSARIYDANYTIPGNIGINSQLWRNHVFDQYGVHGMSPIHTRDTSGSVQVESNTVHDYYFNDFLAIWGQTVNSQSVLGTPVGQGSAMLIIDQHPTLISDNPVLQDGETIQIILATSAPA